MDTSVRIAEYLEKKANEDGEFQEYWDKIREYYSTKLWHQLTLTLTTCFESPKFKSQTDLIELNDVFLTDFRGKINPLALAKFCVAISEQMVASDPHKGIAYLQDIMEKFTTKSKQAAIVCNSAIGMIYLTSLHDHVAALKVIEPTEVDVQSLGGVTPVHTWFYQLSSRYYQETGRHAEYYREALRYLGCVDLKDLSIADQQGWAFSVGLAAILGEDVYNFGELLLHDILNSLRKSSHEWLIDLLHAFNRGDLVQLEALRNQWSKQADLVASEAKMRDKVTLLCLTEMIFRRPVNKRCLTFSDITQITQVPLENVERFLMRALSIGLIKGRIDEVSQTITVSWLQPRVLDREQIGSMRTRLTEWCSAVSSMKSLVETDAKPILV